MAVLGVESFEQVQNVFAESKRALGEILSAFEFWDRASMKLVKAHLDVRDPLSEQTPFYVLIETAGSNKDHDEEKLSTLLEHLMDNSIVVDGALAQDSTQIAGIWRIREGIPEACSKAGAVLKVCVL